MKTIAKTPDFGRVQPINQAGKISERSDAVIGRQHLTALGKPTRLFKVQISKHQCPPRRPEQRAFGKCDKIMASERKGNHSPAMPGPRGQGNALYNALHNSLA
jgi:hypothetical protein